MASRGIVNHAAAGRASLHSAPYDLFILLLTLFSWVVVALLLFYPLSEATKELLQHIDALICVVFFLDFVSNLRRSPSKSGYLTVGGGWLDLLGSVPAVPGLPWMFLLRVARLSRLARIVRARHLRNVDAVWAEFRADRARSALLVTFFTAIAVMTVTAIVVLQVETTRSPDPNIVSGGDAFWWAFVTITTVGYGDRYPTTSVGRIAAMALMTVGIGVFGVFTGFLSSRFLGGEEQDQEPAIVALQDDIAGLKEELTVVKEELAAIREALQELKH